MQRMNHCSSLKSLKDWGYPVEFFWMIVWLPFWSWIKILIKFFGFIHINSGLLKDSAHCCKLAAVSYPASQFFGPLWFSELWKLCRIEQIVRSFNLQIPVLDLIHWAIATLCGLIWSRFSLIPPPVQAVFIIPFPSDSRPKFLIKCPLFINF